MGEINFYRARRDEMLGAAADTKLLQVRERCLRAAAVFAELAEHAEQAEHMRELDRQRRTEAGMAGTQDELA